LEGAVREVSAVGRGGEKQSKSSFLEGSRRFRRAWAILH